ncbi:MAG: DNA topoisomerase IV subunit A [Verrucomicrobia bacterium]|nr:DNA topoisomerase IV subunit A [Verrucomicrobiota bacterium]
MSDKIPDQNEFNFDGSLKTPKDAEAPPDAKRAKRVSAPEPSALPDEKSDKRFSPTGAGGPLQKLVDENFMQYASYVIRDRAIPALVDGLKPVHRRIMHSIYEKDDGRFIKVANVVGHAMQYHPHGDASIADALVTLTNKRYLIEGQGNFGNLLTGDRAAASRYIECRLTELARKEVFNADLTEFVPSYDGRNKEPVLLPAKVPLLLMLGADGIAVGLATRILPYNFKELLEAQIAILQKKPFSVFPDFQQGGLMDVTGLVDGVGPVRIRAQIEKRDDKTLAITEVPFGVTTESLMATIEDAVKKNKLAVKKVTDFTAERVDIVLELRSDANLKKTIHSLYAFTQCEVSTSNSIVVIHEGRPRVMTVSEVLRFNTEQLLITLKQELTFNRQKLLEEVHTKTLVQIFVENRIYKAIESCKTVEAVNEAIRDGLQPFLEKLQRELTEKDIEMLLSVRIRRISLFDINKNRKDIEALLAEIDKIDKNLANMKTYAIRYLRGLIKTYAEDYPRMTRITKFDDIEVKTLTAEDISIEIDRESGYLGSQVEGEELLVITSLDKLLLAWDDGTYKCVPPPEKLFVDKHLRYAAKMDRDRIMTQIYTDHGVTYLKRFSYGGVVLNKLYQSAAKDAKVLLLEEGTPEVLYIRYKKAKRQRITQQMFRPNEVPVKNVKSRGNQLTCKAIDKIATRKPTWWNDDENHPMGVTI